jgi:hypothetical protein
MMSPVIFICGIYALHFKEPRKPIQAGPLIIKPDRRNSTRALENPVRYNGIGAFSYALMIECSLA